MVFKQFCPPKLFSNSSHLKSASENEFFVEASGDAGFHPGFYWVKLGYQFYLAHRSGDRLIPERSLL